MTIQELQQTIHYTYTNDSLLKQAFVHRSFLNEDKSVRESNERLEFLGDAVLSFLTSEFLYTTYPQYPEGKLTNIRSSLVNTKSLSERAKKLNLGSLLLLSKGEQESGGRANVSLLADAFEALLGSLFLDGGIEPVKKLLTEHLFSKTDEIIAKRSYLDSKSLLQEKVQEKLKVSPTYIVVKSEGPDHAKQFWIEARIGNKIIGAGTGHSKQEAEIEAAGDALERANW